MVVCLDDDQVSANLEAIRGKRGADFVYSPRYGEWMIACRDLDVKRRLVRRYRRGVAIYTLVEILRVSLMDEENFRFVHDMVVRFGSEVEK